MTFDVEVNGRTRQVAVERIGNRYRVTIDGRAQLVDLGAVNESTYALILDGDRAVSHNVGLAERGDPGEMEVYLREGVVYTRVGVNGRGRRRRSGSNDFAAGDGVLPIVAPMPGKVVRVLVAPGDEVAARQGLVVIEAMKMENELRSPRAGRVKEVRVSQGMSVEAGRVVVIVE